MKNLTMTRVWQVSAAGLLMAIATVAQAQYVWVDAKGVKQFSDRGPPPDVPLKNILKSPAPAAPPEDADAAGQANTPGKPAAPSLADREAEYRKRKADQAAAEKETAKMAAYHAQRAAACNSARAARAQLDHGRRLRTSNGNIMDDAQRASEASRADAILRECNAQ